MRWPSPKLISQEYLVIQRGMHSHPIGYGNRGEAWAPTVDELARRYGAISILDYGAGQGRLGNALRSKGWQVRDYDPARVGSDDRPGFADLVTCTDVLEHIEADKLDRVLEHIRGLARRAAFFVVSTRAANKRLPNGNNAHLIIEGPKWWRDRILAAGFTIEPEPTVLPEKMPGHCWMGVCTP